MTKNSSIRDYLRVIFRRKFTLFVPILLSLIVIGPTLVLLPEKYQAAAQVKRRDTAALQDARDTPTASVRTLREEILSWQNLNNVIYKLKLDVDLNTAKEWQEKRKDLEDAITIREVARSRDTQFIRIEVIVEDPERAKDIANEIAGQYAEESLGGKRKDLEKAREFTKQRMEIHKHKMEGVAKERAIFRHRHFVELPDVKKRLMDRELQLETEQRSREIQLAAAKKRLEVLEKQLEDVPKTTVTKLPPGENPEVVDLKKQLADRQRVLDALTIEWTNDHPTVKQVRQEIAQLEAQVASLAKDQQETEVKQPNPNYIELERDRYQLQRDIKSFEAGLVKLNADVRANEEKIGRLQAEEPNYERLEAEYKHQVELFENYRKAFTQIEDQLIAVQGRYATRVTVNTPAFAPAMPYRKHHWKIALLCLAGGVTLGVFLMFTLEFCDHSLRNVEDAAEFLQIPVLGSVSVIVPPEEKRRRRRNTLIVFAVLVLLLAIVSGALLFLNELYPVEFNNFFSHIKSKIFG